MIRSTPWREFETVRERIADRRLHANLPHRKPRRIAMLDAETGRLLTGHDTQHRTKAGMRFRCRLRLRAAR
jgi:hypothetical protein